MLKTQGEEGGLTFCRIGQYREELLGLKEMQEVKEPSVRAERALI
jgi:hypothetical protein